MLKKENKIFVAVCPDVRTRRQMISRLAVRLGFALIPSDAAKLIQEDLYSCDLSTAYFVMCAQYNFRNSPVTRGSMKWLPEACVLLWACGRSPGNTNS